MPGLLDLSIVTDRLLAVLRDAETNTHLWTEEPNPPVGIATAGPGVPTGDTTPTQRFAILFTGMAPDAARAASGACKVSLYLFHVAPEQFYANTYPADPRLTDRPTDPADIRAKARYEQRPRRIPQQPLALTLYYLLSAHSESYVEEQQAMSIAMKALHDHPSVRIAIPAHAPTDPTEQSISVVMHPQSVDDVSRLWQAISTPLRMSAVYRASVVFLEPELPTRPAPKPVARYTASAYPEFLISRALVDGAVATITGHHFDDASLVVRLAGVDQTLVRIAPPPPPPAAQPAPPPFGTAQIRGANTIVLRLPSGTHTGDRIRFGVALDSDRLEAIFTITATADVP